MKGIRFGQWFLFISAGILFASLYYHLQFGTTNIIYLFPFFVILLLGIAMIYLYLAQDRNTKIPLWILFLDMNLIFIFLIQMIQIHGQYIWNHPGIYMGIISTAAFLLGFIILLNNLIIQRSNNPV
jgi:NADH:ubiquinone oxidoreductase subunit 6 (subunit J)